MMAAQAATAVAEPSAIEVSVNAHFGVGCLKDTVKASGWDRPIIPHLTPKKKDYFLWDSDLLATMVVCRANGYPLRIHGDPGCGKSEHPRQYCAWLNLPLIEIAGSENKDEASLLGYQKQKIVNGEKVWTWVDGLLTTSVRNGYCCLINEESFISPGVKAQLHSLLDGQPLVLDDNEGEVIMPAKGFQLFLTDNTDGGGDINGVFGGARDTNIATMRRMAHFRLSYPAEDKEKEILVRLYPKLTGAIPLMVKFANAARISAANRELRAPITTDTLIKWCATQVLLKQATTFSDPAERAFRIVHFDGQSSADRMKLAELYSAEIGANNLGA